MLPKDKTPTLGDFALADWLLLGFPSVGKNGRSTIKYLSSKTKPTEKQGRAALAKILLAIAATPFRPSERRRDKLVQVAQLFCPGVETDWVYPPLDPTIKLVRFGPTTRTVYFKGISTKTPDILADMQLAKAVFLLLRAGMGKTKAVETVADKFGLDKDSVFVICRRAGKHKSWGLGFALADTDLSATPDVLGLWRLATEGRKRAARKLPSSDK